MAAADAELTALAAIAGAAASERIGPRHRAEAVMGLVTLLLAAGAALSAFAPLTLAAQAGAQILARGGSAVDAAIAADAAMGVVEPMNSGIGGDLFAIRYDAKTGKLAGMNASGWAPEKLTVGFLKKKGFKHMPHEGV